MPGSSPSPTPSLGCGGGGRTLLFGPCLLWPNGRPSQLLPSTFTVITQSTCSRHTAQYLVTNLIGYITAKFLRLPKIWQSYCCVSANSVWVFNHNIVFLLVFSKYTFAIITVAFTFTITEVGLMEIWCRILDYCNVQQLGLHKWQLWWKICILVCCKLIKLLSYISTKPCQDQSKSDSGYTSYWDMERTHHHAAVL